jgi:hypothetical protein
MAEPDPETLLNRLVDEHWTTAARHAWRQYEERGRGAIVFPIEETGDSGGRTPLRYLTFNDADAADGPFARLYELVQSYNPEQDVVVAAVLPDERTVFDTYHQTPPPPDAA